MKLRSLWLAAALAVTANHVAAQCPDTRVQTVPASHQQIGVQGCGIAELEVGGITIGGPGCRGERRGRARVRGGGGRPSRRAALLPRPALPTSR